MANLEINFEDFSNGSIVENTWSGSGVFDNLMVAINGNIQAQYDSGRLSGTEYAEVYLGSMQTAISEAMKFLLNKKSVEKQLESQEVKIAMDEVSLAESAEKWVLQKKVLINQVEGSNIDLSLKETGALKDLALKDKQLESADADIAFNQSKKIIMEQTRNDNVRSKAAEQFAEFMKYISAANVVPGPTDFKNMRNLVTAMNTGISDPDFVATLDAGTGSDHVDYVDPTATEEGTG